MALSTGICFYQVYGDVQWLYFVKRDAVLLAATILIILAAWMYLDLLYAIGIGAAIFLGLKALAINRQSAISRDVGEGLCAECGERIVKGECPACKA